MNWKKKQIPWETIKKYWITEFNSEIVFSDDEEHILVFKINNEFIILCYLHFYIDRLKGVPKLDFFDFENFIKDVKDFGNKQFENYEIKFLSNRHLAEIKEPDKIKTLPKEIEYYHIEHNDFYNTLKVSKLDFDSVVKYSEYLVEKDRPWYYNKDIKVVSRPWYYSKDIEVEKGNLKYDDWGIWENRGYEREWFEYYEVERFDDFYIDIRIYLKMIVAIDDRTVGFYLIWKDDDFMS